MNLTLDKNKKYLLACSFGPDSMALFALLLEQNYDFEVAHVNYHRRDESSSEAKKLETFCIQKGIPFHYKDAFYPLKGGNFQTWARQVRYEFFAALIRSKQLDYLLTGHQEDDVLETYIMQKDKGKNLFYFGISAHTFLYGVEVLRPLLSFSKSALLAYCQKTMTPYAIDKSNLEDKYHRNYIRHHVINQLTEFERSKMLVELKTRNSVEEKKTLKVQAYVRNGIVNISDYVLLTQQEKERLIYLLYLSCHIPEQYKKGSYLLIEKNLHAKKSTALFKLHKTYYLSKFYGKFAIINLENYQPYQYIIRIEEKHFSSLHIDFDLAGDLGRYNLTPDSFPITLRTSEANDIYLISGYKKKVSRLYVDIKLPKHLRIIWPVIENKNGKIVFIPRYREDFKINPMDKLKILW